MPRTMRTREEVEGRGKCRALSCVASTLPREVVAQVERAAVLQGEGSGADNVVLEEGGLLGARCG